MREPPPSGNRLRWGSVSEDVVGRAAQGVLGRARQVHPLRALVPGARCVGPAFTVRFEDADEPGAAPAANYLEDAPAGAVVVIVFALSWVVGLVY